MNLDMTYCTSTFCPSAKDCSRNYIYNFKFRLETYRYVSVSNLYIEDEDCKYYIKKEE